MIYCHYSINNGASNTSNYRGQVYLIRNQARKHCGEQNYIFGCNFAHLSNIFSDNSEGEACESNEQEDMDEEGNIHYVVVLRFNPVTPDSSKVIHFLKI